MGLLANFKIRTKILFALLPLAIMVIIAALYASIEMNQIDTWYGDLISKDIKALHNLTVARAQTNRFGQLLYNDIAEPDEDSKRMLDAELDKTAVEAHASLDAAKREYPNLASAIAAATDMFDQAVAESHPIRAATLAQSDDKAMSLMRQVFNPEMLKVRKVLTDLADSLHARVDQESDELTRRTGRTIWITWIVIAIGLASSFAVALSIVQIEVVKVVLSFRGRILDVAQG